MSIGTLPLYEAMELEPAPPYVKKYDTSREAAEKIIGKAGELRFRVYHRIRLSGEFGCTDEQIQKAERMDPSTQRPRRVELVRAGLVRDSGRKRRTHSGRFAVVWVAT